MRKLIAAAAAACLSAAAWAGVGIAYKGSVKTEGGPAAQMSAEEKAQMRQMGMGDTESFEFEAQAEGGKFKMTYLTAFTLFPKGSYLLGDGATKQVYFVFPDRREYWEMNVDDMGGAARRMMKSVKMTTSDTRVEVTPLAPKVVGGVPCTGQRVALAYTVSTSFMGMKSRSRTEETTDYYTTSQYDALALFGGVNWHNQGLVTGDAEFDRVIAAKTGFLGFPMEVRTHRVVDGKDQGTTVMGIRDVTVGPVLPGTFALPAGYTKTQAGMGAMLKGAMGGQESQGEASGEGASAADGDGSQTAPPPEKKKRSWRDLLKGSGK